MELAGQVAVVTGAARGIGRAIAQTLAGMGAHVVIADLQEAEAESVAQALRDDGLLATSAFVDVAEPTSVEAMVEQVLSRQGQIDALVNNAGIDAPAGLAWQTSEDAWRRIIEVDLNGAWWCSHAVMPQMMRQQRGRIVNISSLSARLGSTHISPAYSTAKAGLIGLTISLSAQLEAYGIRVNAITPGATGNTGTPFSESGRAQLLSEYPLGFGGPQPIADAVGYLLASTGDWVSGAVLNVSGGQHRGI